MQSLSRVLYAVFLMISPMSCTASMLIPFLVEPTFTLAHTLSVTASASGRDSIRSLSLWVMPFETMAEKPPKKLTPNSLAVLSRVMQIFT